jgi:hypothetical protein
MDITGFHAVSIPTQTATNYGIEIRAVELFNDCFNDNIARPTIAMGSGNMVLNRLGDVFADVTSDSWK